MLRIKPILIGGLAAGTIDIAYAATFWAVKAGLPAQRIFQSVASGLLGPAAFQGGNATAALRLVLHFGIAIAMAATYALVARHWPALVRRPFIYGALYGGLLYAIMNLIVVPVSAAAGGSRNGLWIALTVLVHVVGVGIPCALAARRALAPVAST